MTLNRILVMKQENINHGELKIRGNCEDSTLWLQKVLKNKFVKTSGDKSSACHKAAEKFIDKFASVITAKNLIPEQVYNADATSLF
ncbi:hypothetical protein AAY473_012754 [Plecturocebus cupreus]